MTNAEPPTSDPPTGDLHTLRIRMFAATTATYLVGLAIVQHNPLFVQMVGRAPIKIENVGYQGHLLVHTLLTIIGDNPGLCLVRLAIAALVVQGIKVFLADPTELEPERYRPYVFWRAAYRFLGSIWPFLSRRRLDGPPTSSLTEYERVTVRYFGVKLLFLPIMVSFFFGNLQGFLSQVCAPNGPASFSVPFIHKMYLNWYMTIMLADVAWFAICCAIETRRFSPVVTVDPYASGWIINMACYPPLVELFGRAIVWHVPDFPAVESPIGALIYSVCGIVLFTFYVLADFSFGLKAGNLYYRGLVDKGPFKLIRHPMYSSKNLAWLIFTIPALNFHLQSQSITLGAIHLTATLPSANWAMILPIIAWLGIYAGRAIAEERYLLAFPEYQEYCKRVRYRFFPGVF
ncbi:MAG TPA: hypothetical protein VGK19_11065 [Capsulimonadaceae bacterium]|jgi:protein-S-isoprenylcysteine O-methyltransferase Ste14